MATVPAAQGLRDLAQLLLAGIPHQSAVETLCYTLGGQLTSMKRATAPNDPLFGQLQGALWNILTLTIDGRAGAFERGLGDVLPTFDAPTRRDTAESFTRLAARIEQGIDSGRSAGGAIHETPQSITKEAAAVLFFISDRAPVLCTLDDIETGSDLARATASKAADELVEKEYAHRPEGPRKGLAPTDNGLVIAAKLSTK